MNPQGITDLYICISDLLYSGIREEGWEDLDMHARPPAISEFQRAAIGGQADYWQHRELAKIQN